MKWQINSITGIYSASLFTDAGENIASLASFFDSEKTVDDADGAIRVLVLGLRRSNKDSIESAKHYVEQILLDRYRTLVEEISVLQAELTLKSRQTNQKFERKSCCPPPGKVTRQIGIESVPCFVSDTKNVRSEHDRDTTFGVIRFLTVSEPIRSFIPLKVLPSGTSG